MAADAYPLSLQQYRGGQGGTGGGARWEASVGDWKTNPKQFRRLILAALASAVVANPTMADFEGAVDAIKRGDYRTAVVEFEALAGEGSAAFREYSARAEKGDLDVQWGLAVMYETGLGVELDFREAARWYRLAAEQGLTNAQKKLAAMYDLGRGVPRNSVESAKWIRLAAEQGDADAQHGLGRLYFSGDGVPRDIAEARKWFRRAAEQGNASAQYMMGGFYRRGTGVTQDFTTSLNWHLLAAEQGDSYAQNALGEMYREGEGCPRNTVAAHMWFDLAAARGWRTPRENRDRLAENMTEDEIKEARRLAEEWQPANHRQHVSSVQAPQ